MVTVGAQFCVMIQLVKENVTREHDGDGLYP